jgi:hypothetical protein
MWRGVSQGVCPLGRICRTLWIGHIYNIQYFVTLPLDQSKSIWSSASWLSIYYLLKNPVGKIRSIQYLLDNEIISLELQKENMLVSIIRKNPVGKINDEAYSLVDITSLKTLDEKTLTRQNSYKEKSVIWWYKTGQISRRITPPDPCKHLSLFIPITSTYLWKCWVW